jgi:hypothetical protein
LIGEANPLFPFSTDESNFATDGPVYRLQTAPMTVYPGMRAPEIELDVQMIDVGQLSFELAGAVPEQLTANASDVPYRVDLLVWGSVEPTMPTLPIDPLKSATAHSWPLVGVYRHGLGTFYRAVSQFGDQPAIYNEMTPLPAKKYSLSVHFQANTAALPSQPAFGGGFGGYNFAALPSPARSSTEVEIKPGQRTHVRIVPPENLETTYRELLDEYMANRENDPSLRIQVMQKLQQPQYAKLEVAGYFPLEKRPDPSAHTPLGGGLGGGGLGGFGGGGFGGRPSGGAF